jgi:pimeloyl-ACP methyl ester carboxylesterase
LNPIVIQTEFAHRLISISLLSRDTGKDLVFFIHGLGCAKESFADAFDQPRLSAYSIAAIDLPGFGESPAIGDFSYTLDNYAGICRETLNQFPHNRVHIVGHSMGGAVAVLLAEKIPDRAVSLMNIEGNLTGSDCTTSRRTMSVTYDDFRSRLKRELILSARGSGEKGMRLWAEWSAKSDPLAFTGSARSLVEWSDSGELLSRFLALPCRKVYFYGERSRSIPALSRLGNVPAIMVSRSGHFLMNDNPDEFYSKLAAELADVIS